MYPEEEVRHAISILKSNNITSGEDAMAFVSNVRLQLTKVMDDIAIDEIKNSSAITSIILDPKRQEVYFKGFIEPLFTDV